MTPSDLDTLKPSEVMAQLFDEKDGSSTWWTLERSGEKSFLWKDKRLNLEFPASQGFLVALHEVSTYEQARLFAKQNKISVLANRGIAWRGCAEIAIRCNPLVPPDLLRPIDQLFKLEFANGSDATVAYTSALFRKLIAQPAGEKNSLPDPKTLTTLVISNVDREEVEGAAEICLFHLRDRFPHQQFELVSLERPFREPDDLGQSDDPACISGLFTSSQPWAVAFFNRAIESDDIPAYLYFYRVLEACFDDVIAKHVDNWRSDVALSAFELVKNVRNFSRKEDVWALRKVIGEIATQVQIDKAFEGGLLSSASGDEFAAKIYARRNEIAHGRRGQHNQVLVPFAISFNESSQHSTLWTSLMRSLAHVCMHKWILR